MATIQITLDEPIPTDFTVFGDDQVLTAEQLNENTNYFDDQTRLTRVKLLGVGVICGLRVTLTANNTVVLGKGIGVTTDGDVLFFNDDTVFDRFKPYDASYPNYSHFDGINPFFELVAKSDTATDATLDQFNAQAGRALNDTANPLIAVLFVQSYLKDGALCTGTSCDNKGSTCVNAVKLLLADSATAANLLNQPAAVDPAKLNEIAIDRAVIDSSINTYPDLANRYANACKAILSKLATELPNLFSQCSPLLPDVFSIDPSASWIPKLKAIDATFPPGAAGVQYYYDFLKDVAETYNQLYGACIDLLVCDRTLCCPPTDLFPKHLLLGDLAPGAGPDRHRTLFRPSPALNCGHEKLTRAKFLAQKLNAMILGFQAPPHGTILITPSYFEDRPLEERAIPFYYATDGTTPIQQAWNFRLHQLGKDAWNYSYNAPSYQAQGGAAAPFGSQLGRFPFFRVEGHLGTNISDALKTIESHAQSNNLPFAVRAVFLGPDSKGVVRKPGVLLYSDLNRFHYMLRQHVTNQLTNASDFSTQATNMIHANVTDPAAQNVVTLADQKSATIVSLAPSVAKRLSQPYSAYLADPSWKSDVSNVMNAAAEYKFNTGSVLSGQFVNSIIKTEFTTPFDSLIANANPHWLDWLDTIIQNRNQTQNDKLVFRTFVSENPGVEHFAGVLRGGTLILVHDSSNMVVADFMVPYYLPEPAQAPPPEPPLIPPWELPGKNVFNGIRISQPVTSLLTDNLQTFKTQFQAQIQPQIDVQKQYLDVLKQSFVTVTSVLPKAAIQTKAAGVASTISDPVLNEKVTTLLDQKANVAILTDQASQPGATADTKAALASAQDDLVKTTNDITDHISTNNVAVAPGTDGFTALMQVNDATTVIKNTPAATTLKNNLTVAANKTQNTGLKTFVMGGMLNQ